LNTLKQWGAGDTETHLYCCNHYGEDGHVPVKKEDIMQCITVDCSEMQ